MLIAEMRRIETAARASMGDHANDQHGSEPAPVRGPFAWFRLGILAFAAVVALLWLLGAL
jgi:hypothetical protein